MIARQPGQKRARRGRRFLIACLIAPLLCLAAMRAPCTTEIRFDAYGDVGTEIISVTRDNGLFHVAGPITLGPSARTVAVTCFGPVWNLQIRVEGLNAEPRLLKIKDGVVAVTRRNVFGAVLSSQDWLNIDTRFVGYKHEELYPVASEVMANIRAGYCGTNGQYILVPPSRP